MDPGFHHPVAERRFHAAVPLNGKQLMLDGRARVGFQQPAGSDSSVRALGARKARFLGEHGEPEALAGHAPRRVRHEAGPPPPDRVPAVGAERDRLPRPVVPPPTRPRYHAGISEWLVKEFSKCHTNG